MTDPNTDSTYSTKYLEDRIDLVRAEGRNVQLTEPGEWLTDVDGRPWGMTLPTTHDVMFGPICLTADEWEAIARYLIGKHYDNEEATK